MNFLKIIPKKLFNIQLPSCMYVSSGHVCSPQHCNVLTPQIQGDFFYCYFFFAKQVLRCHFCNSSTTTFVSVWQELPPLQQSCLPALSAVAEEHHSPTSRLNGRATPSPLAQPHPNPAFSQESHSDTSQITCSFFFPMSQSFPAPAAGCAGFCVLA